MKIWQEGTTPLVLAAANNHLECVKELLKNGADPAARRLVSNADYIVFFSSLLEWKLLVLDWEIMWAHTV